METISDNEPDPTRAPRATDSVPELKACHCCGLIHRVPLVSANQLARCTRCGSTIGTPTDARQSATRTAAAALGALILFFPAVLLPILNIERLGHKHES